MSAFWVYKEGVEEIWFLAFPAEPLLRCAERLCDEGQDAEQD